MSETVTGNDRDVVRQIQARLKHAWSPFFGRFGRLLPVQLHAIPAILDGRSVVIATPTASGKTEAVVAPLADEICRVGASSIAVLYVVPTRALANDLADRVGGPLKEMGVPFAIKHGEAGTMTKLRDKAWVVTTPESLDSMLCRMGDGLEHVRAAVIDEVHLMDGTYRGDQLVVLLERLRLRTGQSNLPVHLLSATLHDPNAVARKYVEDFVVIDAGEKRDVEFELVTTLADAVSIAKQRRYRKNLVFCNSRARVEEVAAELVPLWKPYPVVCHHGSLSGVVRKESEAVIRESPVLMAVATSTLEVGIDIGDIDLVILADVPWSLSALVQRIGRGNRRGGSARCIAVAREAGSSALLEQMFARVSAGHTEHEWKRVDLSVVIQQTFSRLFEAQGEIAESELLHLVSRLCPEDAARRIWDHLDGEGWIRRRQGRLSACTKLMDLGAVGKIHSNIPDSKDLRVIDIDSGRQIGRVPHHVDPVFVLARRVWRVVSRSGDVLRVRHHGGAGKSPSFQSSAEEGAFSRLLPPELREPAVRALTGKS